MTKEFYEALFALARRITRDPGIGISRGWLERAEVFKCRICGNYLDENDKASIEAHGLQHLKEHNLLPFI